MGQREVPNRQGLLLNLSLLVGYVSSYCASKKILFSFLFFFFFKLDPEYLQFLVEVSLSRVLLHYFPLNCILFKEYLITKVKISRVFNVSYSIFICILFEIFKIKVRENADQFQDFDLFFIPNFIFPRSV